MGARVGSVPSNPYNRMQLAKGAAMKTQAVGRASGTHPMPANEIRHRYASLDAMRGLAAFAVVVYHLDRPYAPSAYVAVDLFFVLSGFVIARAYGEKLAGGM